jgi:hypothetical protein
VFKIPHKNKEKVPIYSVFGLKNAKKHVFLLLKRIFFVFFFAETVVILIFATTKQLFILFT